jgi:phage terminase Nu1 subunit (DNA packaging protein)
MVNGEAQAVNEMSQAALGRALDLSPPAITKLKKQGMPVHSVEAAQQWRRARQNVAQRKPEPPALQIRVPAPPAVDSLPSPPPQFLNDESHDAARTRREIAEANLAELKLAEQRGELVRAAAVRAALSKRAAALRESFLQLPARVVPLLAADPVPSSMDRILRAEIVAALAQLTEAD